MKLQVTSLCIMFIIFGYTAQSQIQQQQDVQVKQNQSEQKHQISTGVALSFLGGIINSIDLPDSLNAEGPQSTPTFVLNYDYYITDDFRIGAGFSYMSASATIRNFPYTDNNIVELIDIQASLSRKNYRLRTTYDIIHNDEIIVYSGCSLGISNYSFKFSTEVANLTSQDVFKISFAKMISAQIILCGLHYKIDDHFAVQSEICLFSPYILELGASYSL